MSQSREKPGQKSQADQADTILLTGFPCYLARRVGLEILRTRPRARIYLLHGAGEEAVGRLESVLAGLEPDQRARVTPLQGDVSFMNLGLPSDLYRRLVEEVTEIQHLACRYQPQGSDSRLLRSDSPQRRVNVVGTREILELAGECEGLRRMVHWSTVQVSGVREGVVMEEDLECGQRFRSAWEQTRFEAERLVRRAARKLPVTVLRVGAVVGDSDSGELGVYEGPHRLVAGFVQARRDQPVVLPGTGNAPVHLVPVDFVVRAGCHLSTDPSAVGKTFHLVDPSPLPANTVYQAIARKAHRKPTARVLPKALSRLFRLSARVQRLTPFPVAPTDLFDSMVFYNCKNTLTHLAGTKLHCPPFESYVDRLVRYVNQTDERRRVLAQEQLADPLA
jgi:thioester reductase-like protein